MKYGNRWRRAPSLRRTTQLVQMIAVGFAAIMPGLAQADVLDQSHVAYSATYQADYAIENSTSWQQSLAQTFTVGTAGQLSRIGFQAYKYPDVTGNLIFQLLSTTGGVPDPNNATALFQTIVPLSSVPTFSDSTAPYSEIPMTFVDVSSAGLTVAPGQVYAVALRSQSSRPNPYWTLWRTGPADYSAGSLFIERPGDTAWSPLINNGTQDAGFQTFVNASPVPEPSLLLLMSLSTVGFLGWNCRLRWAKQV